jgi:group I intron endonuclease
MLIYKWTNKINGKIYIGQTTKKLEQRTRSHINTANTGSPLPIHNAIRKYGKDSFTVECLGYYDMHAELDAAETFYINQFDCLAPKGYNLKLGGAAGVWHEESREKARVSALKRIEADGGAQLSVALAKGRESLRGKPAHNRGKKVTSTETLKKLSASHLGQTAWNKKAIICNETGEIFNSLKEAATSLGLQSSKICLVLKGERSHTGSYTFQYFNKKAA